MSDQASQLRHLVLRAARQRENEALPPPRIVAVLQAKRGQGATTIAAHLGQALVEQGARVVLIDADPHRRELANRCGVEIPATYNAIVARQDIHEALLPAAGGLQIVPGIWEEQPTLPVERIHQHLLRQFQQLGRHADVLVLDLGQASDDVLRAWHDAIETLLIVTTPTNGPVMESYTLIKQSLLSRAGQGIELLVNRAASEQLADEVFSRVDRSTRRFLGFGIQLAGFLPTDASAESLAALATRLCEARPTSEERRAA